MNDKFAQTNTQSNTGRSGIFTISLDFELFWGLFDKLSIEQYGENVKGVRKAIPGILNLFDKYNIHATWATVGLLCFDTKEELLGHLPPPDKRPQYEHPSLSSYTYLEKAHIGKNEIEDLYHFGASLVREIQKHPGQEIGSHTFSHYYCLEQGQTAETFEVDLVASKQVLAQFNVAPTSLVLPRNQMREDYLPILAKLGFTSYRGNQRHWIHRARSEDKQSNLFIRGLRLIDHYVPLSGHNVHNLEKINGTQNVPMTAKPINIPATIFLRSYSKLLSPIEFIRLARIKRSMTRAAKEGKLCHIWWHPHNFGRYTEQNLSNLETLLKHFKKLETKYGMRSLSMDEIAKKLTISTS